MNDAQRSYVREVIGVIDGHLIFLFDDDVSEYELQVHLDAARGHLDDVLDYIEATYTGPRR